MVLSLLAPHAMHKLFHKISNCISASKNSSIVTFFQLCHKPPSFLVIGLLYVVFVGVIAGLVLLELSKAHMGYLHLVRSFLRCCCSVLNNSWVK